MNGRSDIRQFHDERGIERAVFTGITRGIADQARVASPEVDAVVRVTAHDHVRLRMLEHSVEMRRMHLDVTAKR